MNDQLFFWGSVFVGGFCLYFLKAGTVATWSAIRRRREVVEAEVVPPVPPVIEALRSYGAPIFYAGMPIHEAPPDMADRVMKEIEELEEQRRDDSVQEQLDTGHGHRSPHEEQRCGCPPHEECDHGPLHKSPHDKPAEVEWQHLAQCRSRESDFHSSSKFWKFNDKCCIRILPPPKRVLFGRSCKGCTAESFEVARQHYIDRKSGKVYQCGKRLDERSVWSGECPICDYYEAHRDEWYSASRDPNNKYEPVVRYYYNVAVRKTEDQVYEPAPLVWSTTENVHKQIVAAFQKYGDLTDLRTGRDLSFSMCDAFTSFSRRFRRLPPRLRRRRFFLLSVEAFSSEEAKKIAVGVEPQTNLWEMYWFSRPQEPNWHDQYNGLNKLLANQVDLSQMVDEWHHKSPEELQDAIAAELTRSPSTSPYKLQGWEFAKRGKRAENGELEKGSWVFWETKQGTMSVRPSIVFDVRQEIDFNGRAPDKILLKYKSGEMWKPFWVTVDKCVAIGPQFHEPEAQGIWSEWARYEQQEEMKRQAALDALESKKSPKEYDNEYNKYVKARSTSTPVRVSDR